MPRSRLRGVPLRELIALAFLLVTLGETQILDLVKFMIWPVMERNLFKTSQMVVHVFLSSKKRWVRGGESLEIVTSPFPLPCPALVDMMLESLSIQRTTS